VSKALKAKKAVQKGAAAAAGKKKTWKVRTSVTFHRPKTLKLARNPKYPRRSVPRDPRLDDFAIIKHPLTSESAMKKLEAQNTLVFITDVRANKNQIAHAVERLYEVKAAKINTLVRYVDAACQKGENAAGIDRQYVRCVFVSLRVSRPDGTKKAYVRLTADFEAVDVANKVRPLVKRDRGA